MTRALQVTMTPEGSLSLIELDTLILALKERTSREVLHAQEAADFIGISKATLYRVPKESIPYHYVKGLEARMYLKSEILEAIKKS